MKRHWLITLLAAASALATPLLLWSAFNLMRVRAAGTWVTPPLLQTWLWQILGLFPTPAAIPGLRVIFSQSGTYQSYTAAVPVLLTLQLIAAGCSAAMAYGLWQQLPWSRVGMMTICALETVVQIGLILRYPNYSGYANRGLSSWLELLAGIARLLGTHGSNLATIGISVFCFFFLWRNGFGEARIAAPSGASPAQDHLPPRAITASRVTFLSAIAIPSMSLLGLLLNVQSLRSSDGLLTFALLLLVALPYGVIVWRLRRGPDRFGLGFASGLGLLTVGATALYAPILLFIFLMGLGWGSQQERASAIFVGLLIILVIVLHLFLFIGALRASVLLRGSGAPAPAAWGFGFALPLLILFVLPGLQQQWRSARFSKGNGNVLTTRVSTLPGYTPEDMKRQAAAKAFVRTYARCAFAYAAAHAADGFSTDPAAMGPGGTGCLDVNHLAGHLDGYAFRYLAFSSPGEKRIDQLRVLALPPSSGPDAKASVKQGFLIEETGQLRNVYWNAATSTSPAKLSPDSFNYSQTLSLLYSFSRCLNQARFQSDADEYPQTLDKVLDVSDPATRVKCIADFEMNGPEPITAASLRANHFTWRGYAFSYAPERDHAGHATRYALEARPAKYADEEFRSYRVDTSGIIRYTPLDRPAASSDPEVPLCDLYHQPCEITPAPDS